MVTRRQAVGATLFGLVSLLLPTRLLNHAEAGYGKCSRCRCPGFTGSSYTCSRGGCGHHYNEHW